MTSTGILILEKNRLEFLLLKERLVEVGIAADHLVHCTTLAELDQPSLKDKAPSFIFLDLFLPDSSGVDTFLKVQRAYPGVPIVILSDLKEKEAALQCIHLGAQDYLVKGEFSIQLLSKTMRFANERNAYRMEMEKLKGDYLNLFRQNPMPMWVFDSATLKFLSVNQAAVEKCGYSEEEFYAMTIEDIHLKEDLEGLRATVIVTSPGDAMSSRGVWRHRKKDGAIIFVEIFSRSVMYQDRLAVIGSSIDVTEKLQAEATERQMRLQIEERNSQIEGILESISECFFLLDGAWRVQYWNTAAEKMYHIQRQDILGKSIWDVFPNASITLREVYERTIQQKTTEHFEYYSSVINKWISISVYPTQDGGLTVFIKDMTEERQRNLEVLETRNNYQALIDFTGDDIWSIDRDMKLITGNRSFQERMFRLNGRHLEKGDAVLSEELPPEAYQKWKSRYETVLSGQQVHLEEAVRFHNGDFFLMEVQFNPIRNAGGDVVGAACHSHQLRRGEE